MIAKRKIRIKWKTCNKLKKKKTTEIGGINRQVIESRVMFSSSSVHAEILDATVLTRISTTQQYLILYISTLLFLYLWSFFPLYWQIGSKEKKKETGESVGEKLVRLEPEVFTYLLNHRDKLPPILYITYCNINLYYTYYYIIFQNNFTLAW